MFMFFLRNKAIFDACWVAAVVRAGRVGKLFGRPLKDEWSHLAVFSWFFYQMFLHAKGLYFSYFYRQAWPLLRLSGTSAARKNYKSARLRLYIFA